jgi:serralysin
MATFVASQPLDMRTFFSRTDGQPEVANSGSATTITMVKTNSTFVATGVFRYDSDNEPTDSSTVSAMQESWNGSLAWRLTGINLSIGSIERYYDDDDNFDDDGFVNFVFAGNDSIVGSAGADTLRGYGGNDSIAGGSGNDVLLGGAGADTLNGGTGADRMLGGAGNDTYAVDNTADKVFETTSFTNSTDAGGTDKVNSSVSFNLAASTGVSFVENLTLTGTVATNGSGNARANTLTGNGSANVLKGENGNDALVGASGADTLYGGAQNDLLRGGAGNDVLHGGPGDDKFRFDTALSTSAVKNVDRVVDFNPAQDTIQLENSIFTKFGTGTTGAINPAYFKMNTTGVAQDSNDYIVYETDTGKLFYDANGSAAGGSVQFALLQPNLVLTGADYVLV